MPIYNVYNNIDILNNNIVAEKSGKKAENVILFETIDSTNNYIKQNFKSLSYGTVVIAENQTAGKGRLGRSFLSFNSSGIYMSVYLKALESSEASLKITAAAAVVVSEAIEKCAKKFPKIKWVNDLILENRKICGILCEGIVSPESARLEGVVLGIGINVYKPENDFAEEIKDIAGHIADKPCENLRNDIIAEILKGLDDLDLENNSVLKDYRERSCVLGKEILVLKNGESKKAKALEIDENFHLKVLYSDGLEESLSFGEVSIRV